MWKYFSKYIDKRKIQRSLPYKLQYANRWFSIQSISDNNFQHIYNLTFFWKIAHKLIKFCIVKFWNKKWLLNFSIAFVKFETKLFKFERLNHFKIYLKNSKKFFYKSNWAIAPDITDKKWMIYALTCTTVTWGIERARHFCNKANRAAVFYLW